MGKKKILFILTVLCFNILTLNNSYASGKALFLDTVKSWISEGISESFWGFLQSVLDEKVNTLIDYNVSQWESALADLFENIIDKSNSNYTDKDFNKDFWDIFNNLLNRQNKSLNLGMETLKNTYINAFSKNIIIWNKDAILSFHKKTCENLIDADKLIIDKKIFAVKVKFNEIKFSKSWFKNIDTLNAFKDNLQKYNKYLKNRESFCSDSYNNTLKNLIQIVNYINNNKKAFNDKYWSSYLSKTINTFITQTLIIK